LEKFAGIHPLKGKVLLGKPIPVLLRESISIEHAREIARELHKGGAKVSVKASRLTANASFASPSNFVKPKLEFIGSEPVNIRGTLFTRYNISVQNSSEIPKELFLAAPDLPPCGRNTNSSRTWVDILNQNGKRIYGYCALSNPASLSKLSFSIKKGSAAPKSVQLVLNDRRARNIIKSNLAPLLKTFSQKETKYQVRNASCTQEVAPTPFHFDTRLHSYIYRFLDNQGSAELIRHELQYDGVPHSYYIDANQRNIVYYFPDKFRMARREKPPFAPRMLVQINSREDDSGVSDVIVFYLAAPIVDRQRLAQAAAVFAGNLSPDGPSIDLQPFPVVDYSFHVSHPIAIGSRSSDQDVSANVFYQGIHNTLLMELPDFVACFAALTNQTQTSFHGTVSVMIGDDEQVHLPFVADFSDLSGKLFDHAVLEDEDGNVSLTLINSIESALNIRDLTIELERDGNTTDTTLTSAPALPSLLASGESISLGIVPDTPLIGTKPLTALINTRDIDVVLDDDAVFNSILDRSTTEYFRMITVKVVENVFRAFSGRESEQVVALIVHVEGSQGTESIELDIENLEGNAKVQYSVDDLILRNETSTSYRYWYQVARANGSTETVEPQELLTSLHSVADQRNLKKEDALSLASLIEIVDENLENLPISLISIDNNSELFSTHNFPDQVSRQFFLERIVDHIIDRFSKSTFVNPDNELCSVLSKADEFGSGVFEWNFSDPLVIERLWTVIASPFHAMHSQLSEVQLSQLVEEKELPFISGNKNQVSVYANFANDAESIVFLGANIHQEAFPPDRPVALNKSLEFAGGDLSARIFVHKNPDNTINYYVEGVMVMETGRGIISCRGTASLSTEPLLILGPEDFSVNSISVSLGPSWHGVFNAEFSLTFRHAAKRHRMNGKLDASNSTLQFPVPDNAGDVKGQVLLRDIASNKTLENKFSGTSNIVINPFAYPQCGIQTARIVGHFSDTETWQAAELRPANNKGESATDISVVHLTPAKSEILWRWFSHSPFDAAYQYRELDRFGTAKHEWITVEYPYEPICLGKTINTNSESTVVTGSL